MPKQKAIYLSSAEQDTLREFTSTGQRSAQALNRARILLWTDRKGAAKTDVEIARLLGVAVSTVERVRSRYHQEGLAALLVRKPRRDRGIPLKIDGRVEARLTALACSETPHGEPVWTLSMIADELVRLDIVESISRETVRQKLKKTRSAHI